MERTADKAASTAKPAAKTDRDRESDSMWRQFKKSGEERLRNRLIERYLPLVRYNSERIWSKLPDGVDLGDLIQAGTFGLMGAIDSFDLSKNVKFETYCAARIRGAILDELRNMDWVPRLVRARARQLHQATRALEISLGRAPTEPEIAGELGMTLEEFQRLQREAAAVGIVSLSRKWFETDSHKDVCEIDLLEDKRGIDPLDSIQKKDLRWLVTRGLSKQEKLILLLYYYEDMTMKEIGAALDLSESRVSQLHSSIVARLKAKLTDRRGEFDQDETT
jgi:RNA polymerase sigma factor for flagellar operon FliA